MAGYSDFGHTFDDVMTFFNVHCDREGMMGLGARITVAIDRYH